MDDAWQGTVIGKSRGLYDGANMYRKVKVELPDGTRRRIRVPRDLWKAINKGDVLVKEAGTDPVVRTST